LDCERCKGITLGRERAFQLVSGGWEGLGEGGALM